MSDIEALACAIRDAVLVGPMGPNSRAVHAGGGMVSLTGSEASDAARALLASDWLAAHDAATRADERALVLGELGSVTLVEWRVRYGDGDTDGDGTRKYAEDAIADARTAIAAGEFDAEDYEPMELVYRTVTTTPDGISEWVVSE